MLTIGQLAFLAVAVLEDLEMVEPLVLESLVRATREVREDRLVATVLLAVEVVLGLLEGLFLPTKLEMVEVGYLLPLRAHL